MSDSTHISATKRTEFGKGAARRIRRAHQIPAVLYGHGSDPLHVSLPGHETMLALKVQNAVLTLDVDGEEHLALAKDVQRDPIKRVIEHVDLVIVLKGEKVTVDIAIHIEGEAAPETVVTVENNTVSVEAPATDIPEHLTVSVEGAVAGTQVHASDLELPAGVTLDSEPELLVVNITQAISAEALEAELAEAEAEVGIEQDEPESTEDGAAPDSGEAEGDKSED